MLSPDILPYLADLKQNNNKAWFEANRARYDAARANFIDFLADTIKELGTRMDLSHVEPKQCIFRINRDVRFSKNKDPYKSNFAAAISPEGKNTHKPGGIYISIGPDENFIGMGLYDISPEQLKAIRQEIDYNLAAWEGHLNAPAFKKYFGTVQGEQLKTTPKGYEAENPAIQWLKYKQFYVGHQPIQEQILSKDFVSHIGRVYDAGVPFIGFLSDAIAGL
jgi:uncharacterized protein (TIGR02453 family)